MTFITAAMLPSLLGRPVAYQPVFTRLPGVTVQGAIFLSQALFLCGTPTARKRDGWFWKEQQGDSDSWEAETGMSAKQQVTARRQLVRIGVLEEVRKGVPAKTWYRVNTEVLAQRLAKVLAEDEVPEQPAAPATAHNLPTGESENAQPENQDSLEGSAQNRPTGDFLQRLQQRSTPPSSEARDAGADPFGQAAGLDDNGQPLGEPMAPPAPGQRQQPMTYDWAPDADQLAIACFRRGLPSETRPDAATLADFTAHFAEKPQQRLTQQGWHERLAKWLAENRHKPQPGTGPTTGGSAHDRATVDRPRHDRAEREAVRQQLANPHDTSWADGWWPGEPGGDAQGAGAGAGEPDLQPPGGDLSEDIFECVPECGPAEAEQARAGDGAGAVAGVADPAGGGAGDQRDEARGEYLATDDPRVDRHAGAYTGGLRYAGGR